MYYTGISDEAGQSIDAQIKAHDELGWEHLELRMVDGVNITQLSDEAFDAVVDALEQAGKRISCFGSAIANWARPITCDPEIDRDDLRRAIPRMQRCGTQFIRVMSYPNDPKSPVDESQWRRESIARMKELAKLAADGGITLCHENCSGWGGLSAENSNILLGEVDSPALKLVFDTGNPVAYGVDSWDYYQALSDDIVYVHVKDAQHAEGAEVYTYCGEGDGSVERILRDLLGRGYDGGISIEPHLAAVIHTGETTDDASELYNSYVTYGRKLMAIVDPIVAELAR
ncbi:MAG: sugar phosphate isomerase/epimerase [Planctomycetales bacterium]|nr:sugar phosphate isomerase/epimerase [Planctomycetales bacterium]MCA9226948.1 sugar phosphate isomerase/epimerase [Planctomycetales bacterium]